MISKGYTLIEILIALTILAIALTAIMLSWQQNSRDLSYLEDRVLAHYVALNIIDKTRGNILQPAKPAITGEETSVEHHYQWQLTTEKMANSALQQAAVQVSLRHQLLEKINFIYLPSANHS